MARFLTRLANSVTRVVLVAPCLLTCSCATSFPLDELEVGMTMEQTIEAFGEPSSRGLDECWTRRAADPPSVVWRRCEAVGESETLGPVAVMSTWVYPQVDL